MISDLWLFWFVVVRVLVVFIVRSHVHVICSCLRSLLNSCCGDVHVIRVCDRDHVFMIFMSMVKNLFLI